MKRVTRRALGALAAAVLLAAGGCGGGDEESGRDADDAFAEVERDARRPPDPDRAAPRWEPVATLRGDEGSSAPVEIADGAVNWRARWRCERGDFVLSVDGERLARDRCPGSGSVESLETGRLRLSVTARADWRVRVSQQVTTPLDEAPLDGMGDVIARGPFYGVERRGTGRAELHRLPDGRLALRFEGFRTSANSDLFVWLSEASRPRTTRQALRAPHRAVALLKSTLGDQNYLLPRDADAAAIRSIVIWCEPVRIAYAAATLAG